MQLPVYLDYAATTPVDPLVADAMAKCLTLDGQFGNPASRSHLYGWQAEELVENARRDVADLINCDPREIVWTSGATEADNLAIKGVAGFHATKGRHIISSRVEHKAVLDSCHFLEQKGFEITYLTPEADGSIAPARVAEAIRDDTILVTLMHVNNETGSVNDLAAIGAITREHNVLLHVDAAQSAGKLPIDLAELPVDLMSLSAHKVYGPKGVGALFVRRDPRVELTAQIHGGGHERGMRSGTLPTHQLVGMGQAFRLARAQMSEEYQRLLVLREQLLAGLAGVSGWQLHGQSGGGVPGIVNLGFAGVDGESLLLALRQIAVSSGSACMSATLEPSYVLKAMGVDEDMAQSALRISFGRFSTRQDIDTALENLIRTLQHLRQPARAQA
ncbi:IscS subfamily cysteine desulfurase [Pseudohongiella sp.]|uniref:cysteine desulfurase n=1 Tax=marine sediment metagenome TaxID=412755 RepID=A0A0F9YFR2_9ZZZZ|nr:IscS subfamily cysteine desulfurase [Pseudohongiella sp.]HDZ09551.1 IscS subfamily cysteine desulfurase [Pseudohongiella sp.]HEA62627.1 IscS subfamily cysteine desulfurase [Pseudohongiella sp.]